MNTGTNCYVCRRKLVNDIDITVENIEIPCSDCNATFLGRQNLESHYMNDHNLMSARFCKSCCHFLSQEHSKQETSADIQISRGTMSNKITPFSSCETETPASRNAAHRTEENLLGTDNGLPTQNTEIHPMPSLDQFLQITDDEILPPASSFCLSETRVKTPGILHDETHSTSHLGTEHLQMEDNQQAQHAQHAQHAERNIADAMLESLMRLIYEQKAAAQAVSSVPSNKISRSTKKRNRSSKATVNPKRTSINEEMHYYLETAKKEMNKVRARNPGWSAGKGHDNRGVPITATRAGRIRKQGGTKETIDPATAYSRREVEGCEKIVAETVLKCDKCAEAFADNGALKRHAARAHKQKPDTMENTCYICCAKFMSKVNMARHLRICHFGPLNFTCSTCDAFFTSLASFTTHQNQKHGVPPDSVQKRLMTTVVQEDNVVGGDMKVRGGGVGKRKKKPAFFMCDICQATSNRKANVQRHIRLKHDKMRLFRCCDCGKRFGTRHNLQVHRSSLHGAPGGLDKVIEGFSRSNPNAIDNE